MYPFTCLYAELVKSVSENELVHSKYMNVLIIYSYVFIAGEENSLNFVQSVLLFALFFILSDKIADLYHYGISRWKKNRVKAG